MVNAHKKLPNSRFEYGTAGFRNKGELLDHVMYRMGMLAVLRARLLQASIGVMVTASHNPEEDNGVKLVDPGGEMMEEEWEEVATKLANADDDELQNVIDDLINKHDIPSNPSPTVVIAMDTRKSSKHLAQCVEDGAEDMNGVYNNFGELTTPQLHYIVRCYNNLNDGRPYYGEPTEDYYVSKLTYAFIQLNGENREKTVLYVDGANGVGAQKVALFKDKLGDILDLRIVNDGTTGRLNYLCGADYVKTNQKTPPTMPVEPGNMCCSFDGDADRIVFYSHDNDGKFCLLDGDKTAVLLAEYISELMHKTGSNFSLGLVQTAYANGASTRYIQDRGISVACTPTGVKNLHKAALKYDIGVYFEANGHGTIIFKPHVQEALRKKSDSPDIAQACKDFLAFIDLTNQTVGDAISDMLLVIAVLRRRGWWLQQWMKLYQDLPNKLLKVKIKERRVIETGDAERIVLKPSSLQPIIDKLILQYPSARSFVRPSGTEDVVRVYAEAQNQDDVHKLAWQVACAVYDEAGGVSDRPTLSH